LNVEASDDAPKGSKRESIRVLINPPGPIKID